eukprot:1894571-Rhodomonas_salina.3
MAHRASACWAVRVRRVTITVQSRSTQAGTGTASDSELHRMPVPTSTAPGLSHSGLFKLIYKRHQRRSSLRRAQWANAYVRLPTLPGALAKPRFQRARHPGRRRRACPGLRCPSTAQGGKDAPIPRSTPAGTRWSGTEGTGGSVGLRRQSEPPEAARARCGRHPERLSPCRSCTRTSTAPCTQAQLRGWSATQERRARSWGVAAYW